MAKSLPQHPEAKRCRRKQQHQHTNILLPYLFRFKQCSTSVNLLKHCTYFLFYKYKCEWITHQTLPHPLTFSSINTSVCKSKKYSRRGRQLNVGISQTARESIPFSLALDQVDYFRRLRWSPTPTISSSLYHTDPCDTHRLSWRGSVSNQEPCGS